MMHKPIQIKNLSLSFSHKSCFEDFNTEILNGNRIAIIGPNGSGKSTLLKMLQGLVEPTEGSILCSADLIFGYVPQIIDTFEILSGGQRLNEALTKALSIQPHILLLDEPTNHLDRHNRKSLMRMLQSYSGTLIIVSHDTELLRTCADTLWHIDQNKIHVFNGQYDDYIQEKAKNRASIEQALAHLERQKKEMHHALMKEQKRAAKSKAKGEKSIHQKKWPTIVSAAKAGRSEETSGRKKSAINNKKQDLIDQLSDLRLPEIIVPTFSLNGASRGDQTLITISNGTIGYFNKEPFLQKISLSLGSKERIAILGDNGSGKSTLIKAILKNHIIITSGDWYVPKINEIGYLDQHYESLSPNKTVLDSMIELVPTWSPIEIRRHLNNFLFRKNEEVNSLIMHLSGGEKVRLSLAHIAARTPKLLILDEMTNNLDLETKAHVIQVLKAYPGAMIVISHEEDFLQKIGIECYYQMGQGFLLKYRG